jgi:hypothetical protein
MKQILKSALARAGLELARTADRQSAAIADLAPADRDLVLRVEPFTMTTLDRRASLVGAIDHVVRHAIAGDIVECGVWRGGSMMLAALALIARGDTSRHLWLYDTFQGMSEPGAEDRSVRARPPPRRSRARRAARASGARPASPTCAPTSNRPAIRRSASTSSRARSRTRFRRRCRGGSRCCASTPTGTSRPGTSCTTSIRCSRATAILVIDDYGYWQGARQAVDEYFAARPGPIYLHRVDNTARLLVKQDAA